MRLAALDEERERLLIELRAFEEALAIVEAEAPRVVVGALSDGGEPRRRRSAVNWATVLGTFATPSRPTFGIDDVARAAEAAGYHPSRSAVRGQLATLVTRERATRIEDGVFQLTPLGLSEIAGGQIGDGTDQIDDAATSDEAAA